MPKSGRLDKLMPMSGRLDKLMPKSGRLDKLMPKSGSTVINTLDMLDNLLHYMNQCLVWFKSLL